mmetsp:Transcript_38455/g.81537  ORF Transcript_38455/g.81537 Transcript_38455/m.81537 type:complete len:233 (+) Transcript_38455:2421-3119(+)
MTDLIGRLMANLQRVAVVVGAVGAEEDGQEVGGLEGAEMEKETQEDGTKATIGHRRIGGEEATTIITIATTEIAIMAATTAELAPVTARGNVLTNDVADTAEDMGRVRSRLRTGVTIRPKVRVKDRALQAVGVAEDLWKRLLESGGTRTLEDCLHHHHRQILVVVGMRQRLATDMLMVDAGARAEAAGAAAVAADAAVVAAAAAEAAERDADEEEFLGTCSADGGTTIEASS